jgi:hypothetical protein
MTKFFIDRPVLANVIALLTIIMGLVALLRLPVSQYPNVVPPTVQVTTRYPGAGAAVLAREVALPLEQKVNGVGGYDLHVFDQHQRRRLHPHGHVPDRRRCGQGPDPGSEPGR